MKPLAPVPDSRAGRGALAAWTRDRSILSALSSLHQELGDVFRLPLPGFDAVMLAGAQANHFVLVEGREQLRWRMEGDPVGRLLRNGLLMQDGAAHDRLRAVMSPALHRDRVARHVETMTRYTDDMVASWDDAPRDMLVEMRRLALFILTDTLFGVDVRPQLDRLWEPLLRALAYISPGVWLVWHNAPRPGYRAALEQLDEFLYGLIAARRRGGPARGDLLDDLIAALGADDDLIRDQLITMLIAGHDTSTAHLAWTLYLFGAYPAAQAAARAEVDTVIGGATPSAEHAANLIFLDRVIKESLRLYPPIHLGNRRAAVDLEFGGCAIPADTRVLYSIYLSHRDPRVWCEPDRFQPERFAPARAPAAPPFTYLPFGAGPRFCIGAPFAQVEAKIVLGRLLQQFEFDLVTRTVRPHMGATLEPRPRVLMRARRRNEKRPRSFAGAERISK
jgi:cytochrome P450